MICCLILILCALSSPAWAAPQKFYLSIGVNSYDDAYWRPLQFAAKDAQDIESALKEKFNGGMLLNGSHRPDKRVERKDILRELEKISLENREENDVIVLYISAHGTIGRNSKGKIEKYLLTSDSRPNDLENTAISHTELFQRFNSLKSIRKVLILDSCYSGVGKSRLNKTMMQALAQSKSDFFKEPEQDVREGTVILAAAAWGEEADESPVLKNGLYTHFLIEGFDRDYNGDGAVTITEAHQFAVTQVEEFSKGAQHPSARMEMVGQDPIIIRGSRSGGSPILFAYEWVTQHMKVAINGKPMGSLKKGGLLLPEGTQHLELFDEAGATVVSRHVTFEKGREYPLSQFVYEDPQWSIRANAWLGSALSPQDNKKAIPGTIQGYQLELQKEEGLRTFDLQVRALLFPKQSDLIESADSKVEQDLSGGRLALMLGKHFMSNRRVRKDWNTYSSLQGGPVFIYLDRRVKEEAFRKPEQKTKAAGLAFSGEYGLESLMAEVQLGLRIGLETYYSNWNFGPDFHSLGSAELVAGFIW